MEAKDYLDLALARESKRLYINFLEMLEDIHHQHDSNFRKLYDSLPEEYKAQVIQASYFDENGHAHFRKRALDHGNELIRSIRTELEKYEIDFKR